MRKIIAFVFFAIAILIYLFVIYKKSVIQNATHPLSSYSLLSTSWENYKKDFIRDDGSSFDPSINNATTSEGQSYAMLRSVWMGDRETFDKVWEWTNKTIKRKDDNLFGWKWGEQNGKYDFYPNGSNSASDADIDIALALILASRRWQDSKYEFDAKKIVTDIWEYETVSIKGKRYLTAGNWATGENVIVINPSYFAPYAFRLFGEVDKTHKWNDLIDTSYEVLNKVSDANLDKSSTSFLPPDWASLDINTLDIKLPVNGLTTNYSYDAVRVPFRIALDYEWNNDPRAKDYLTKAFKFLEDEYKNKGKINASYEHDGNVKENYESPVMYATFLPYLLTNNKDLAEKMYQEKILKAYSTGEEMFRKDLSYYDQNWLWFGVAFREGVLKKY